MAALASKQVDGLYGADIVQLDEPYMDISLGKLVKKRATWLVVLFLGEMLTATAMSGEYFFE